MKSSAELTSFLVGSLMLLAAFSPALALTSPIMAPAMTALNSTLEYSYNWSGYAVSNTSVTFVTGSWVVPTVTAPTSGSNFGFSFTAGSSLTSDSILAPVSHPDPGSPRTTTYYAAFWLGIDGFTSNTVEQTGLIAEITTGSTTPTWYAFYEFYPSAAVLTKETVSIGATINASVTYSSSSFTTTVTDIADGWSISSQATPVASAARSSAEWIVETPSVNGRLASLADFGAPTSMFSSCYATTASTGATLTAIGSFTNVYPIEMVTETSTTHHMVAMATPSSLNTGTPAGTAFTVTWDNAGP